MKTSSEHCQSCLGTKTDAQLLVEGWSTLLPQEDFYGMGKVGPGLNIYINYYDNNIYYYMIYYFILE